MKLRLWPHKNSYLIHWLPGFKIETWSKILSTFWLNKLHAIQKKTLRFWPHAWKFLIYFLVQFLARYLSWNTKGKYKSNMNKKSDYDHIRIQYFPKA